MTAFERGIGPKAIKVELHTTSFKSLLVDDVIVLDVSLPPGYESEPLRRYPVLYVTDGYWRRDQHGELHALTQEGATMPFIIVGIGYPDGYDFNKVRVRDLVRRPDLFLQCLKKEVIPAIDQEYRTDPDRRVLWGSSFGGFFCLYAFGQHENAGRLFSSYLCVSPSLSPSLSHPDIMASLRELHQKSTVPPAVLFLATGEAEAEPFLQSFKQLDVFFRSTGFQGMCFNSHLYSEENHFSVMLPALLDGVRGVFKAGSDPAASTVHRLAR